MSTIIRILMSGAIQMVVSTACAGPVEIAVKRRVIEKEERIQRPRLQAEEQTTVLGIAVTNKTGKQATFTIDWAVLVSRAGERRDRLVSGSMQMAALANSQTGSTDTTPFPVIRTRAGRQDLEYKIVVKQNGKEVARAVSTEKFDQIAAGAAPQRRPKR